MNRRDKKCPRFNNLYGIRKILKLDLDGDKGIRTADWDRVGVIVGPERIGKSHLLQWIFDIWYKELLQDPEYNESYIKFLGANKREFIDALKTIYRFGLAAHDEAIKDMYNMDGNKKFSKQINKAYAIIGGKNLHTILVLPNILTLNKFFREWRVKYCIHVFGRGKLAYYGYEKLNELLPALDQMSKGKTRPDISKACNCVTGIKILPDFTDTYPKYDGVLLKPYLERKSNNMEQVIEELDRDLNDEEEVVQKKKVGAPDQSEVFRQAVRDRYFGKGKWFGKPMKKRYIQQDLDITPQMLNKCLAGAPEFLEKADN